MGKVIVKALEKQNWAGMNRYPKCHDHIVARKTRAGYVTGLTDKEATKLEKELGLEEGQLSAHSDYWREYSVPMTDRDLHLDPEVSPRDALDLALLKADVRVANSLGERYNWPKAEYIIYDAEEDAQLENSLINEKVRAISKFNELTPASIKNYLKLLGRNANGMSDAVAKNTLFHIATEEHEDFNRITDLPDFKTRIMLYDLMSAGLVKVNGGSYFYGKTSLGLGEDAAAQFLDDPKNQELKMALKTALSKK